MKTFKNIIANITNRIDTSINTNFKTYLYLSTFTALVAAVAFHIGLS